MSIFDVLTENSSFEPASVADAAAWRERWGLDYPVLADTDGAWAATWGDPANPSYAQHAYTLLDADGIVLWRAEGNPTYDDRMLNLIVAELEKL